MLHHYILDDYLILKILREHPQITAYEISRILKEISMSIPIAALYRIVYRLMNDKLIQITGRAYRIHGIVKQPKSAIHKRCSYTLELTGNGHKKLIELECRLHICMSLTVDGRKI